MKKFLVLLIVCLFVLLSCDFISPSDTTTADATMAQTATTTRTKRTTAVVTTKAVVTAIQLDDPTHGLTDNEVEYLLNLAISKNFPCTSIDDIADMRCTGRYHSILVSPEMVWVTDYENVEYGVLVKNGPAGNFCIPVKLLEEWNIDISDRIRQ